SKSPSETVSLTDGKPVARKAKVAVNLVFLHRLLAILKICVPSLRSKESFYILVLTALLICKLLIALFLISQFINNLARTILSVMIAEITGLNAETLVSRDWKG